MEDLVGVDVLIKEFSHTLPVELIMTLAEIRKTANRKEQCICRKTVACTEYCSSPTGKLRILSTFTVSNTDLFYSFHCYVF
jgi:hypothetical protein